MLFISGSNEAFGFSDQLRLKSANFKEGELSERERYNNNKAETIRSGHKNA